MVKIQISASIDESVSIELEKIMVKHQWGLSKVINDKLKESFKL